MCVRFPIFITKLHNHPINNAISLPLKRMNRHILWDRENIHLQLFGDMTLLEFKANALLS